MKRVLSNKWSILVFVLPTVLFFTFIVIIPIIMSIFYSLLDWTSKTAPTIEYFTGIQNYIDMFTEKRATFPRAVGHSMLYAAASVFIQLPFSLFIALLLSRSVKGENMYRNLFFIPVIISSVVVGQLWMKLYNNDYGPMNMLLRVFGIPLPKNGWLATKDTKLLAVFIPSLWQYVGYHMLLMYGALKSISPDITEAAIVDGATGAKLALRIQIPLIKPMLKVCLSFSLIGSFKLFDTPYILLGLSAKNAELPAVSMYFEMFRNHRYGIGSAEAIFIVVECLVFTVLLNVLFREEKVGRGRRLAPQ